MKKCLLSLFAFLLALFTKAADKDSIVHYALPDSVKASQFLAEMKVQSIPTKKEVFAGIQTDIVKLSFESDKGGREIVFEFPASARVLVKGLNTDGSEKGEIGWKYNWEINETYKLLIAVATDSAENFSLYSGYAWLPRENKWKLIGTCRIDGRWSMLRDPASFYSTVRKTNMQVSFGQVWCQRPNGSWKNMKSETLPAPVINLFPHVDSIAQRQIDKQLIDDALTAGKVDAKDYFEGVNYKMLKEGTGRQVSVNDTVTVFYRVTLFSDGSLVDETKDKPAIFPLKRLIRGWQIAVPLCKVGGKIRLVIPSDLAYTIRTRSADIPPNSILVFEIEIVDAKSP